MFGALEVSPVNVREDIGQNNLQFPYFIYKSTLKQTFLRRLVIVSLQTVYKNSMKLGIKETDRRNNLFT